MGMADEHLAAFRAAAAGRLRLIVERACAWPDERDDILMAARALGVHAADPLADHPLAALYRALQRAAATEGTVSLSHEHRSLLGEAIRMLEAGTGRAGRGPETP